MKCKYCDNNISDSAQYCDLCGQQVVESDLKLSNYEGFWESANRINSKYEEKATNEKRKFLLVQKKRKKTIFIIVGLVFAVEVIIFYIAFMRPVVLYNQATDLYNEGKYEGAKSIYLQNIEYKDSREMVEACEMGIIEDEYQLIISLYEDGKYEEALYNFRELSDYKDSEKYICKCERALLREANVWGIVEFGYFGEAPLEWRVLEKTEDEVLLVACYYINEQVANKISYNSYEMYNCWSQSSLRDWLNDDFLVLAFNSVEKKYILNTNNVTSEFDIDNYDGVNANPIIVETTDTVYIPSVADVELYGLNPVTYTENSNWDDAWLRDRGENLGEQCTLTWGGTCGWDILYEGSNGVLPMIRVRL